MSEHVGRLVCVDGIVQGVGFRPFVYSLANRLNLTGSVYNSPQGVRIQLFGNSHAIVEFLTDLRHQPPPLATIRSVEVDEIPFEEHTGFRILASSDDSSATVAVTPDAAICADCRRELFDPQDRRYHYPFINCTNCGPRYSIIEGVPYDRPMTTMRKFIMCPNCQHEYDNPASRRHHAQPNCCPACGPQLSFHDEKGKQVDGDALAIAIELLEKGGILALKGLGGFHLACDASNEEAVNRLRERKYREEKPLAVMVRDVDIAGSLISMPVYGERLLTSPAAPILVSRKQNVDHIIASAVAPVNDYLGVMLPYTPLHMLLLEIGPPILVMTSANRTDEPICIDNDEAVERLCGIADAFLMHNRDISLRLDDSVVIAGADAPAIVRRARGYVPEPIETNIDVQGIMAFGPHLKNTLAIGRGTQVFAGQHVGDLDNLMALDMCDEITDHLGAVLGVKPELVACDLQPDFPSTRRAEATGLPLTRVQHHHAHLVGLMAEKQSYGQAIGIAFDGTGYGTDGEIWGGEIMVFTPLDFERAFHLEYVPLPGGDRAAKEPWRMATSYLHHHGLDPLEFVKDKRTSDLLEILEKKMAPRLTSSMGRLFDAVSSICGLCQESTFEAKAPMLLEGAARSVDGYYDFTLTDGLIKTGELITGIVEDCRRSVDTATIAGKFHNTIAEIIVSAATSIRAERGLDTVFLSGGVMINQVLLSRAVTRLREENFSPRIHRILPPNDGAVSVGQAVVAAWRRQEAR